MHTVTFNINSIEYDIFEMDYDRKEMALATILYPNESYGSLTQNQLDKVREILNEFK